MVDSQGIDIVHQYKDTDRYLSRFNTYKHAIDGRNIHQEIIDWVAKHAEGPIVDIGCGDGAVLKELAKRVDANLIGVDVHPRPLKNFIQASAEDLSFIPDHSIGCVLALFMLYHVPNPEQALKEFKRILKPGGTLIVAISGLGNKMRQAKMQGLIASRLGIPVPPRFNAPFDALAAQQTLPKYFKTIEPHSHISDAHYNKDTIQDFIASIESNYQPADISKEEWSAMTREIVLPIAEKEIKEKGYFWDRIERHWWVCK